MVRAASAAIIDATGRILLIKRSEKSSAFPGHWGFPGGREEDADTSLEATVRREVKEEVGLDFEPTHLYSTWHWRDRELFRYIGTFSGEISPQIEEVAEYGWFTHEQACKLPLAFEYADVLRQLHSDNLL